MKPGKKDWRLCLLFRLNFQNQNLQSWIFGCLWWEEHVPCSLRTNHSFDICMYSNLKHENSLRRLARAAGYHKDKSLPVSEPQHYRISFAENKCRRTNSPRKLMKQQISSYSDGQSGEMIVYGCGPYPATGRVCISSHLSGMLRYGEQVPKAKRSCSKTSA